MAAKHDIKYKKNLVYSIYIMIFVTLNLIHRTMHTKCDVRLTQIFLNLYQKLFILCSKQTFDIRHAGNLMVAHTRHFLILFMFREQNDLPCDIPILPVICHVCNKYNIDRFGILYICPSSLYTMNVITNIPYDTVPCVL